MRAHAISLYLCCRAASRGFLRPLAVDVSNAASLLKMPKISPCMSILKFSAFGDSGDRLLLLQGQRMIMMRTQMLLYLGCIGLMIFYGMTFSLMRGAGGD